MDYWYKHSFRRNLVDMHINDLDPAFMSKFSPLEYAETLSLAGVDTAIVYAGSCLGINYFPTSNGHVHSSLKGRDIVGETVKACRERGLGVVLYFNIWSRWAYDNHPEWRMRDIGGRGYSVDMGQRFGQCCPNTGYLEYVKSLFGDLVRGYDCEGYWIDMIGWFTNVCYCEGCRRRFKSETGHELPTVIDWDNEVFLAFERKREQWFAEMAAALTKIAKDKNPALTVSQQCSSWPLGRLGGCTKGFFACSDYLAGDFYVYGAAQSVTLKYLANMASARPVEYMVSRCPDLAEHTLTKPDYELTAQRYAALAGNAAFVFIDAIDPVGTLDRRIYEKMGEIFAGSEKFEKYLDPEAKPMADVGLIVSQAALFSPEDSGKSTTGWSLPPSLDKVYAAAEALIRENITFDVLDLSAPDKLQEKKVLVLCDIAYMTKEEAQILREYVRGGGCLYASCSSSLSGGEFMLSDVFGADFLGTEEHDYNYVAPLKQYRELLGGFNEKYPLPVRGVFTKIRGGEQAEILAVTSECIYRPNDPNLFASAISNPPGEPTGRPSLVRGRYGRGTCIYACACIEAIKNPNAQNAFVSLIKEMVETPLIVCDAPWQIEAQVFRSGNRLSVNFNYCGSAAPPVPVYGINAAVYVGDAKVESVFDVGLGEEAAYELSGGYVVAKVSEVTYYNSLQIKFE